MFFLLLFHLQCLHQFKKLFVIRKDICLFNAYECMLPVQNFFSALTELLETEVVISTMRY